jgi:hypothetical protein
VNYESCYRNLIAVGRKYGFRPDVPLDAEDFFRKLVASYTGNDDDFMPWLDEQAKRYYASLLLSPRWIQDPEWPLFQGEPMLFVGQVDIPFGASSLLNHEASFYVFWDRTTGATKVVVQAD